MHVLDRTKLFDLVLRLWTTILKYNQQLIFKEDLQWLTFTSDNVGIDYWDSIFLEYVAYSSFAGGYSTSKTYNIHIEDKKSTCKIH